MPSRPKFQNPHIRLSTEQRPVRSVVVSGPEDPRYFDLAYFPQALPGQNWIDARREQIAAIEARVSKKPRSRTGGTITISDNSAHHRAGHWGGSDGTGRYSGPDRDRRLADDFDKLIPLRPFSADVLADGLQIRNREAALLRKHIQLNGPTAYRWVIHDIDRSDAHSAHRDSVLAEPNFIAINKENGHAHSAALLAVPVAKHQNARLEPLRYFAAVERGYARRLGADRRYAGLIVKNPMHAAWRVEWRNETATSLEIMASWLDPADMMAETSLDTTTGAGRNVTVFDDLRTFAYHEVIEFKRTGLGFEAFQARLEQVALGINHQFPRSLPFSEIRSIAKSVCKWTWAHFSIEKFADLQAERGRRGMAKRWAGHVSADKSRPWAVEGISRRAWYRRKAAKRGKP